jgi:hypothetical protein
MGQDGEDGEGGGARVTGPDSGFDDEIRSALRYERGLAVKALLAIALVVVILVLRQFVFG